MGFSLSDVLHVVGQALLRPCMAVLIVFLIVTVWQLGSVIVEFFTERRKMKDDIPALLKQIHLCGRENIVSLIDNSRLIRRQKQALHVLLEAGEMPRASLTALAQRLLAIQEDYYERGTAITDLVVKLGPMFGLLGTLIPLGPGIVALGQGDTVTLSKSLTVAFDTTIAGLLSAGICYVVSNIRKRWYEEYLSNIETMMDCILEEVGADD